MYQPGWQQDLNLYFSALSGRWSTYISASRAITDNHNLAMMAMDYLLSEKWRLGSLLTYYRFSDSTYNDLELTVSRVLFGQQVGLRWSAETGRVTLSAIGLSRTF